MDDFDRLVRFLRKNRYWVKVKREDSEEGDTYQYHYRFADVRGKGIRAGFCYPPGNTSEYLDGRVAADNGKCFNKWSQCPLVVRVPTTDFERDKLLKYFAYLATPEGHDWSNKFGYMDDPRLPRETAYKDFQIINPSRPENGQQEVSA